MLLMHLTVFLTLRFSLEIVDENSLKEKQFHKLTKNEKAVILTVVLSLLLVPLLTQE